MNHLVLLIPAALLLGALGLGAFLWALRSGQYDDLDGAAWRVLDDETSDRSGPEDAAASDSDPARPFDSHESSSRRTGA